MRTRAAVLAARLGWIDQVDRVDVRGDVLVVGSNLRGDEVDIPRAVILAARACRLLPDPTSGIAW